MTFKKRTWRPGQVHGVATRAPPDEVYVDASDIWRRELQSVAQLMPLEL